MVFWNFWVLGSILAHQTTKSNSVDNFASLDTPGSPGGVKVVEWNQNQLIRSLCPGVTLPVTTSQCHPPGVNLPVWSY